MRHSARQPAAAARTRSLRGLRDRLDRGRGETAHDHYRLRSRGAERARALTLRVRQFVIRRRRKQNWMRERLSKKRHARIHMANVHQHAWLQANRSERLAVRNHRALIARAPGNITVRQR